MEIQRVYSPLTQIGLQSRYHFLNFNYYSNNEQVMKRILLFLLVIGNVHLVCAQNKTDKANALIKEALPHNEHALSVLVAKGDNILFEQVVGFSNVEKKTMADRATIFRIGSVTKQFTAVAILKLEEMGKLKVTDPLSKYIKDFPKGDEVTIHHLLTHTSGIKSYTDKPDFLETVEKPVATEELVDEIKTLGYDFEPGEKWKYSNSGYYLLGYIIEQVSGKSYAKYLNEYLFRPANMDHSGIYDNDKKYNNEALGYMVEDEKVKSATNWDMTWAGGAGNIYSTARDLYRWNKHIFEGNILSKESLTKAHSPVKLNDGSDYPYGYGWAIDDYRGLTSIGHSGGLHGFLSYLVYYPSIDATVVVLSNASPPLYVVPAKFGQELTKIFFKEYLTENEEVAVNTDMYKLYAGQYEYPGGAIMTITVEDNKLFAKLGGQPQFEIYPKGDHQFFWKVVDAEITFHLDEAGKVDYATHKQNGFSSKVPKIEEKKTVEMDSKAFQRFAGEYNLNGAAAKVWEEEGKYYTQIQGQPKFQIFPSAENKFFMKEMNVEIQFNGSGDKAESMTIFQAGREFTAPRK